MPNPLFISDNASFAEDLCGQIKYYAPEFSLVEEKDAGILDIVVLDDKPALLKDIRASHPKTPVFLLLSETDEVFGNSNLNITVAKPLQLDAFLNQLRAGSNLLDNSADGYLHFNRYELRPVAREILNLRNHETVKLTEKEVAIIKYLYKAKDKIVSKNELLQEVWGYSPDVSTHTIETHIYRLRQKVEHENPDAQLIMTEDGGYKLKM